MLLRPKPRSGFYSDFRCYKSLVYFLSGLPSFTNVPPSLATPVERTNFQVVCQAEGFPRPVINWSRLRMPLPAGRTEVNQGTLIIKNLIPADSGSYECIATNTMGTKKATINVAVQQLMLGMCACVLLLLLLLFFVVVVVFLFCFVFFFRGNQREYSSKSLKYSTVEPSFSI